MELHPIPRPPEAGLGPLVDQGEIRRLHRGPLTVSQVLGRALAAMLDEDQAERQAADPVTWLRTEHRRKRTMLGRLLGRVN